jgi:hypothetical protein
VETETDVRDRLIRVINVGDTADDAKPIDGEPNVIGLENEDGYLFFLVITPAG